MATPMNESENGVEMVLIKKVLLLLLYRNTTRGSEQKEKKKKRGLCQIENVEGEVIGRGDTDSAQREREKRRRASLTGRQL